MSSASFSRLNISALVLVFIAGAMYCAAHLLNGWVFHFFEISDHINFIYLPSFIRLINVLVLGLLWGTLGTASGGLMLLIWSSENLFIALCNIAVSASSAAIALIAMRILQQRNLSLTRLSDLLLLALLYAFLNALLHHLLWSLLDPSQLIEPNQLIYMIVGDINGAVLGAVALRCLAKKTQIVQLIRKRALNTH